SRTNASSEYLGLPPLPSPQITTTSHPASRTQRAPPSAPELSSQLAQPVVKIATAPPSESTPSTAPLQGSSRPVAKRSTAPTAPPPSVPNTRRKKSPQIPHPATRTRHERTTAPPETAARGTGGRVSPSAAKTEPSHRTRPEESGESHPA